MMNELADRLEKLSRRIELAYVEQDSKTVICSLNDLNQEVWKSRESIIKALRFAADMERLMHEHAQPWFEDCVGGKTELRVTVRYEVRYFYGSDIYTAARRAVEALKKGE